MKSARTLAFAIVLLAASGGPALASPDFALFDRSKDCVTRDGRDELPQSVLVDRNLSNLNFSQASIVGVAGSLGAVYQAATNSCHGDPRCLAAQARMTESTRTLFATALFNRLRPFLIATPSDAEFEVVRTGTPPDDEEAMVSLLNGEAQWFVIRCRPAPTPRPEMADRGARPSQNRWIVGQNRTELLDAFADREFASVAYSDDDEKGSESLVVEGALGYLLDSNTLLYVSANYSRTHTATSDALGVDNVDFGVSRTMRLDRNDLVFTARWETDHEFDSSMGAAEIAWSPLYRFLPCLGRFAEPERNRLICDYRLIMDYAGIAEPGGKGSLAAVGEYWRAGLDASVDYYQPLGENRGFLQWSAGYQRREALDGDDGQAESMRAGVSFLPGRQSQFSIGFSYVRGEDVSSLEPQDLFKIKLGYRR